MTDEYVSWLHSRYNVDTQSMTVVGDTMHCIYKKYWAIVNGVRDWINAGASENRNVFFSEFSY
jgi:hypothetical protein